jgi:hypothetical protein
VLPASRSLSRKKISPPGRPNEVQYNHHDPQADARDDVVVVLLDDIGFGQASAFGGPCKMQTAETTIRQQIGKL